MIWPLAAFVDNEPARAARRELASWSDADIERALESLRRIARISATYAGARAVERHRMRHALLVQLSPSDRSALAIIEASRRAFFNERQLFGAQKEISEARDRQRRYHQQQSDNAQNPRKGFTAEQIEEIKKHYTKYLAKHHGSDRGWSKHCCRDLNLDLDPRTLRNYLKH